MQAKNRKIRNGTLGVGILHLVSGLAMAEGDSLSASPLVQDAVKNVEFSGFVSVRGGQIREQDLVYAYKYDDRISFSKESIFGLQMNSTASENVNVSMQMTASGGDKPVELQWAYLEYSFSTDFSARVGRLRVPGFMLSEFLNVGYAYPWVQTPEEVYGWLPFSHYEGVDLHYQTSVGSTDFRLNPYLGTTSGQGLSLGDYKFTDQTSEFVGLEVQASYDILSARAGYTKYRFDLSHSVWDEVIDQAVNGKVYVPEIGNDYITYFEGVEQPGLVDFVEKVMVDGLLQQLIDNPGLRPIVGVSATTGELEAEQQSLLAQLPAYQTIPGMDGKSDGSFAGVGFSLDNGRYLVMSELSRSQIDGVYPDVDSGYVMVGYRWGAWMPHLTFAKMDTADDDERPDLGALHLNQAIWYGTADSPLAQVADATLVYGDLFSVANGLIQLKQETTTLGVRWDPVAGVAVKLDLFRVRPTDGSYGFALPSTLIALMESSDASIADLSIPDPPKKIDGLRVAIDAVF